MVVGIVLLLHNHHATTVMGIFYTCGYISSPEEVDFGWFEA